MRHHLVRSSPKGGPFLGTCVCCGIGRLAAAQAQLECPNPAGLVESEAMELLRRRVKDSCVG